MSLTVQYRKQRKKGRRSTAESRKNTSKSENFDLLQSEKKRKRNGVVAENQMCNNRIIVNSSTENGNGDLE